MDEVKRGWRCLPSFLPPTRSSCSSCTFPALYEAFGLFQSSPTGASSFAVVLKPSVPLRSSSLWHTSRRDRPSPERALPHLNNLSSRERFDTAPFRRPRLLPSPPRAATLSRTLAEVQLAPLDCTSTHGELASHLAHSAASSLTPLLNSRRRHDSARPLPSLSSPESIGLRVFASLTVVTKHLTQPKLPRLALCLLNWAAVGLAFVVPQVHRHVYRRSLRDDLGGSSLRRAGFIDLPSFSLESLVANTL